MAFIKLMLWNFKKVLKIPEKINEKTTVLLNIKKNSKTEDRNCFYCVNLITVIS